MCIRDSWYIDSRAISVSAKSHGAGDLYPDGPGRWSYQHQPSWRLDNNDPKNVGYRPAFRPTRVGCRKAPANPEPPFVAPMPTHGLPDSGCVPRVRSKNDYC